MNVTAFVLAARLLWDPNNEADLSHYIVYSGWQSGTYDAYQTTLDASFAPLESGRFYAVRAVDLAGQVSGYSNEVQYRTNAMTDTVFVQDSLKLDLKFSRPEVVPDYSALKIEHRFTQGAFIGEWRPLTSQFGDYSISFEGSVVINVTKLREYLVPDIAYNFDLRVSYNNDEPVTPTHPIVFTAVENRLLEVIPY